MLMKTLIVAGALILAAAGGTAYAADDVLTNDDVLTKPETFSTLGGINAEALSSDEMDTTRGMLDPQYTGFLPMSGLSLMDRFSTRLEPEYTG